VVQCVIQCAKCRSVLQRVAVCCSVLQEVLPSLSRFRLLREAYVAVRCSVLQCVAVCCSLSLRINGSLLQMCVTTHSTFHKHIPRCTIHRVLHIKGSLFWIDGSLLQIDGSLLQIRRPAHSTFFNLFKIQRFYKHNPRCTIHRDSHVHGSVLWMMGLFCR